MFDPARTAPPLCYRTTRSFRLVPFCSATSSSPSVFRLLPNNLSLISFPTSFSDTPLSPPTEDSLDQAGRLAVATSRVHSASRISPSSSTGRGPLTSNSSALETGVERPHRRFEGCPGKRAAGERRRGKSTHRAHLHLLLLALFCQRERQPSPHILHLLLSSYASGSLGI